MSERDPEHDTFIDTVLRAPALWRRALSALIDGAVVAAAATAVALPFGPPMPLAAPFDPDAWSRWLGGGAAPVFGVAVVLMAALLQGALLRTPGKLVCGLELVSAGDGEAIGRSRRVVRAAVLLATNALAGLGTAWIVVSPRQRALYDVATKTALVVRPRR